jgi:hypothetical protein
VYLLLPKTVQVQELKDSKGKLTVVEPTSPGATTSPDAMETEQASPLFGQPFQPGSAQALAASGKKRTLRISGEIPTEVWNRLGRTLLPKLKTAGELHLAIDASVEIGLDSIGLRQEIEQILRDLNLSQTVRIEVV